MSKLKNSAMLVVAALCGYLALMTPDWKQDLVATTNPGYFDDFYGNGEGGWIWHGQHSGWEGKHHIWKLDWAARNVNFVKPVRGYPPDWDAALEYDILTTGDFDADGDSDFLFRAVANGDNRWKIWTIQTGTRSGQFSPLFDGSHNYTVLGTGDTDRDGDDDVIMYDASTGEVIEWVMEGGNKTAGYTSLGTKAGWTPERIGDFDGDGDADIMIRNLSTNAQVIWELEANALSLEHALPAQATGWNSACSGDFNNDGTTDIMMLEAGTNRTKFWKMLNNARDSQIFTAPSGDWIFRGCADYNADGHQDTMWQSVDGLGKNRVIGFVNFVWSDNVRTNPYAGTDPSSPGYGMEYRASGN
jgi:hypothetical protein